MDEFIESPVKEGYRNHCEFVIGTNKETEHPVIGFRVASYKEGSVEVGGISHLRHINDKTKKIVKSMEDILKESEHKPYDPFTHEGVWRQLTVRTSNNNDLMIIVVIHPQELSEDDVQAVKDSIVEFFSVGDGSDVGVTSIFLQQNNEKDSLKEVDYEHLWGKEYIEETILGKTFRASPDAFLQPNTAACELLYTKVAEVLEIDQTTVLLDICCGVGTIGLSTAGNAYKVFGVESNRSSVENARSNCEINEVVNAVFYHGKAEDYIDNMIERSERVNTVAVVNPPKLGLNGSVMNALRKCEYMDKLVYVTSDPQSALTNFQALGRPRSKNYKGSYFVPIRATPVDMYPDTPNFELVIVFERYDECKWDRIMAGNPRPKDQAYYDRVPELKYDPEQAKRERDEKRQKEKAERKKDNPRRGGGSRNARWSRERNYDDRGDERGPRSWGGGRGRRRDNYDYYDDRPPRQFVEPLMQQPQQYGVGFQEGFRAGLEALQAASKAPGNLSGFGLGGGWNMAQTQGGYNQGEEDYIMNNARLGGGTWGQGYRGNNSNMGGGFRNNMVMGGFNKGKGLLADPVDVGNGYNGWNQNQNFGGGTSGWGAGGNSQGSWNQDDDDDDYPPPLLKKFRGNDSNAGGYNKYNFGNYKR